MISKTSEKVASKQLDMLYRQLPFSLSVTVVISGVLLFFLNDFPDKTSLRIWVTILLLVVLFRAFSTALYYKEKKQSSFYIKKFEILFITGIVLGSMIWGVLGYWLYPMSTTTYDHMIIIIVLVGVAGGSMTSLSYRKLPSILFISMTLLPLIIGLYHSPVHQAVFLRIVLILYTCFLLKNALFFQKNNEQALLFKEKALIGEEKLRNSQRESDANGLYLDSILQSSTKTAIVATDTEFSISYLNPKAEEMFGMDKNSVLGENFMEIHKEHDNSTMNMCSLNQIAEKIRETGVHEFSMEIEAMVICVQINIISDHSGQFSGFLLLANDITIRKETEKQLMKARQEAEAVSLAKSTFLANMSHDINSPINDIIGMTNLALDTELTLRQQKYLENIKLSTHGLLGLLNDILDVSKIEAGQLVIEQHDFNLLEMLNNIISMMTVTANENGLEIVFQNDTPDLAVHVIGDELRLRQILVNIIGNSINFTEEGSVTLKIIPEAMEDNKVEFHFMVIDTGPGIPVDKLDTIFSSFTQVDSSTTQKFGCTGLGMTICKQLVELMGGKIWFENNPDQGATFHFTIVFSNGNEKTVSTH